MSRTIRISDDARHDFLSLPKHIQRQIQAKITRLAEDPTAADVKPLHGQLRGVFRARSGDYRVWFQANDDLISILRITNRKDGYHR